MLELLEPITESIVCTRNSSPRAMSAAQLGAIAEELYGPDRVHVVPDFPDAIDTAVTLAESDNAVPGTIGILITGSVVTVADARGLLKR